MKFVMKGRRVELDGRTPYEALERPGDYVGPLEGYTGGSPSVHFLVPFGPDDNQPEYARSLHHVASPPHQFTEGPNGLTVTASIGCGPKENYYWHGYLTDGDWYLA